MRITKKHLFLTTTALFYSTQALSQEQAVGSKGNSAFSEGRLEEIVVTAQKRSENSQNVPIAISALSSETLTEMGIDDTQALETGVPSLTFINTGLISQIYLRGIGTRFTLAGLEPSVAVYIGERYAPRATGGIFSFGPEVERVEVLKGPQGTLYGRNATGGAIRIVRKDVDDTFGGTVRAGIGNYDQLNLAAAINVPIAEGLGIRLSSQFERRDGYERNLARDLVPNAPKKVDNKNYWKLGGHVKWSPGDGMDMDLAVDYWRQNDRQAQDVIAINPQFNTGTLLGGLTGTRQGEVATSMAAKNDGDELSSEFKFGLDLGTMQLVSVSTYSDFKMAYAVDGDGTSAPFLDSFEGTYNKSTTWSQEVRVLSDSAMPFRWIIGANYFDDDVTSQALFNTPQLPMRATVAQNVRTKAKAVFGEATYDFTEQLSVTLGGRYSWEKKRIFAGEPDRPGFTRGVTFLPLERSDSWEKFTPKATVQYEWSKSMIYATFSRGFKSGGYSAPITPNDIALRPEVLDMYEIGHKGDYFDRSLRLNAAAFYYEYTDLQVTRAGSSGDTIIIRTENAADATIKGAELDVTWYPTSQLEIAFGGTYLDSKYSEFSTTAKVFNNSLGTSMFGMSDRPYDASGDRLLRAPDLAGYARLTYDFVLPTARLPVTVNYAYKGIYYFDFVADQASKSFKQDAYGLFNARATYIPDNGDWLIAVWANNILDKKYFDDAVGNFSGIRASYGEPRTFGLDFTMNF